MDSPIKRRYLAVIILLLLAAIIVATLSYRHSRDYQETRFTMDTEVYIEAHGPGARKAVKEALAAMEDLSQRLDSYSVTGEIAAINAAAGIKAVHVSQDTFVVIQKALEIARLTGGAFDPTCGPLVNLWGIGPEGNHKPVPSPEEIKKAVQLVNYQRVILNEEAQTVFLPEKGMRLELGAIAKGYAVSKAVAILHNHNIQSALVAAGGNIYALGTRPGGGGWRIGIRDPRHPETEAGYLELVNQAIDTSGDYERYYEEQGLKYNHIFDPRSGYPVTFTASSTVITPDPVVADALATALFILGAGEGFPLLAKVLDTEGLIITTNGDVFCTPGLQGKFIKKEAPPPQSTGWQTKKLVIEVNGREIQSLVLTGSEKQLHLRVPLEKGEAIVEIDGGRARVLPLPRDICPDGICSRTGWISRPGQSIICLPNRLVVRIIS